MRMTKRQRLRRRAIVYSGMALVLSAIVWASLKLVDISDVHIFTGLFHVETVQVVGVSTGRAADVRSVIKKQPNASLNELDLEKVHEAVMRLPWVKEARLRKEWPDALVVKITERTPFAWVEGRMPAGSEKGRYRLVDEDGVELGAIERPTAGFPVIRLGSISNAPDPGRTRLKAGTRVLKAITASGIEPEALESMEVEVRDAQDVRLRYHGLPLRLGFGDPQDQIRRFLFLKPELLARAPEISEVDLRFPGRLIVRSKVEDRAKKYRTAAPVAVRPASLKGR